MIACGMGRAMLMTMLMGCAEEAESRTFAQSVADDQCEEMMDLLAHQMRKQALLLSAAMGDIIALQRTKLAEVPAEDQAALEQQFAKAERQP